MSRSQGPAYGPAHGTVLVHACIRAVCPHVEWALSAELGRDVKLEWTPQPIRAGLLRMEYRWSGRAGTGARIASALRAFPDLRFDVTEDASADHESERFSSTPELGVYRATTGPHGDTMIHEDRIRALLASGEDLRTGLERLLGSAWDRDLDPYRASGASESVQPLHSAM